MPNYKGHLVGGFVMYCMALFLLALSPSVLTAIEWLLFALLGSLFPDIDIHSKGQKIFYRVLLILFGIVLIKQRFSSLLILCCVALLPQVVRHRGIFHTVWFVIGIPMSLVLYTWYCSPVYFDIVRWDATFFMLGALSHLWLDLGFKRMFKFR